MMTGDEQRGTADRSGRRHTAPVINTVSEWDRAAYSIASVLLFESNVVGAYQEDACAFGAGERDEAIVHTHTHRAVGDVHPYGDADVPCGYSDGARAVQPLCEPYNPCAGAFFLYCGRSGCRKVKCRSEVQKATRQ
jgi:hypothetical protein